MYHLLGLCVLCARCGRNKLISLYIRRHRTASLYVWGLKSDPATQSHIKWQRARLHKYTNTYRKYAQAKRTLSTAWKKKRQTQNDENDEAAKNCQGLREHICVARLAAEIQVKLLIHHP